MLTTLIIKSQNEQHKVDTRFIQRINRSKPDELPTSITITMSNTSRYLIVGDEKQVAIGYKELSDILGSEMIGLDGDHKFVYVDCDTILYTDPISVEEDNADSNDPVIAETFVLLNSFLTKATLLIDDIRKDMFDAKLKASADNTPQQLNTAMLEAIEKLSKKWELTYN